MKHVRKTVQFVARFGTRVATVALAKRPLGIWWSMAQIRGCVAVSIVWSPRGSLHYSGLDVWRANRTLKQALEQSLDYLALTDFLSTMWPCHGAFLTPPSNFPANLLYSWSAFPTQPNSRSILSSAMNSSRRACLVASQSREQCLSPV